ncbi:MAG: ABC transporter permease [Gemmataceae bacterium]
MNVRALRWLIADTFYQSLWSGAFWLFLTASGICAVLCLVLPARYLSPPGINIGANTLGLLLAVTFTAGFIPSFVDPTSALILLAKPVRRWQLLLGKFVGVLAVVALQSLIFVLATWLALGIATGKWSADYFWNFPLLVLNFTAFFSFSVMLAVTTRNTVACVFGTIMFWLMCWLMNVGRHALIAYDLEQFTTASRVLAEAGYWLLPKPADLCVVQYNALSTEPVQSVVSDFGRVEDKGAFHPALSIVASLLFPLLTLVISGYELESADY